MKDGLLKILNGEDPYIGISEVRFKTIDATMYFFVDKNIEKENALVVRLSDLCTRLNNSEVPGVGHWTFKATTSSDRLRSLPESCLENGYTEFERDLVSNYNVNVECGRLIRDNGKFDEIVYFVNNPKGSKLKFTIIDRNGYELEFEV